METKLIILTYNSADVSIEMINSALKFGLLLSDIIVIDNASPNKDFIKIKEIFNESLEIIVNEKNLGYGGAFNSAVNLCKSKYICILNSDMVFVSNPFNMLETFYKNNPKTGVLGVQQIFPDHTLQRSFGYFLSIEEILGKLLFLNKLISINKKKIKKVDYVDGAFMFLSRELFISIQGFDENFYFYYEDMDICKRISDLGKQNFILNDLKIIHHRGFSSNKKGTLISEFSINNFNKSLLFYINKHFNPNYCKSIYLFLLVFQSVKQIVIHTLLRNSRSKYNIFRNKKLLKTIFFK